MKLIKIILLSIIFFNCAKAKNQEDCIKFEMPKIEGKIDKIILIHEETGKKIVIKNNEIDSISSNLNAGYAEFIKFSSKDKMFFYKSNSLKFMIFYNDNYFKHEGVTYKF